MDTGAQRKDQTLSQKRTGSMTHRIRAETQLDPEWHGNSCCLEYQGQKAIENEASGFTAACDHVIHTGPWLVVTQTHILAAAAMPAHHCFVMTSSSLMAMRIIRNRCGL